MSGDDILPPGRERLSDDEIDAELERLRERLRQRQESADKTRAGAAEEATTDPCADQGERCARATEYLRRSRITDIVLDTTPGFRVQPLQASAPTESFADILAKETFRPWIGTGGSMIAQGRLSDYRYGQVYIQNTNGGMQALAWSTLSDADRCYVAGVWGFRPSAACPPRAMRPVAGRR